MTTANNNLNSESKEPKPLNIYITSLFDRLLYDIKLDITKIRSRWVVSDFENIVSGGYFRYDGFFFQKGYEDKEKKMEYRRIYASGWAGIYNSWVNPNKHKVLTFRDYLIDVSYSDSEWGERFST